MTAIILPFPPRYPEPPDDHGGILALTAWVAVIVGSIAGWVGLIWWALS